MFLQVRVLQVLLLQGHVLQVHVLQVLVLQLQSSPVSIPENTVHGQGSRGASL